MDKWFYAFLITQVIEVPFYTLAAKKWARPALRYASLRKILIIGFGASLITHPFVWFVFPKLPWWPNYSCYLLTAEVFAFLVESFYLRSFGMHRVFLISFMANGSSWFLGQFV